MVAGFRNYDELAEKIHEVFSVSRDQMGTEICYDFGLRSLKGALVQACGYLHRLTGVVEADPAAGSLGDAKLLEHITYMEEEEEERKERARKKALQSEMNASRRSQMTGSQLRSVAERGSNASKMMKKEMVLDATSPEASQHGRTGGEEPSIRGDSTHQPPLNKS